MKIVKFTNKFFSVWSKFLWRNDIPRVNELKQMKNEKMKNEKMKNEKMKNEKWMKTSHWLAEYHSVKETLIIKFLSLKMRGK